jgi:hypothetical protein
MFEITSTLALLALLVPAADAPPPPAPDTKESGSQAAADFIFQSRDLIEDYKASRWEECAKKARTLWEKDPTSYLPPYYVAACYSHMKDEQNGALWIERALEANHPQGGELKRDLELTWLASRDSVKKVFERRKERVDARHEGVLRHQRFDFNLPEWNDPAKKGALAEYRGKTVAVLIIAKHDDESSIIAATAIQAIHDELSGRGFAAVALHVESQPRKDVLHYAIEKFRAESSWRGPSLLGTKRDLFPLVVEGFPAVVFVDAAGVARFIEEGYKDAQATRYRERANALVEEAGKAGARPQPPADGKPGR